MISTKSSALNKAVCEYRKITSDERKRMLIQAREDAWRDEEARKKAAVEDAKIQITKNLLNIGLSINKIVQATGLSELDINKLR